MTTRLIPAQRTKACRGDCRQDVSSSSLKSRKVGKQTSACWFPSRTLPSPSHCSSHPAPITRDTDLCRGPPGALTVWPLQPSLQPIFPACNTSTLRIICSFISLAENVAGVAHFTHQCLVSGNAGTTKSM